MHCFEVAASPSGEEGRRDHRTDWILDREEFELMRRTPASVSTDLKSLLQDDPKDRAEQEDRDGQEEEREPQTKGEENHVVRPSDDEPGEHRRKRKEACDGRPDWECEERLQDSGEQIVGEESHQERRGEQGAEHEEGARLTGRRDHRARKGRGEHRIAQEQADEAGEGRDPGEPRDPRGEVS